MRMLMLSGTILLAAITGAAAQTADPVGEWLVKEYEGKTGDVNIVELQGTTGSAPAIDRQTGFAEKIKANPNLKIVKTQTGDFKRAFDAFAAKRKPRFDGA